MEILNYALRESLLKKEKSNNRHKERACCDLFNENIEKKSTSWTKLMNKHTIFKIFLLIFLVVVVLAWHQNSRMVGIYNFQSKRKF